MSKSFIVGDAGGSSTEWRIVVEDNIQQLKTIGFNAYTHNFLDLKESISQVFGSDLGSGLPVYFYAAGADTLEQKAELEKNLKELFGQDLTVENDLVGAARSLCGTGSGNVCILGTGSNACHYDGTVVDKVSASLGYVLGDEGSGAYLGKKLLMRVFRNQLATELIDAFNKTFDLDSHRVITRIYDQPRPNHFLASFAPFISEHRAHPEMYELIYKGFEEFFHAFFYRQHHLEDQFHFSGSIAYHFSDILRQVGADLKFRIGHIVESPISGLVLYHQNHD